MRFRDDIDLDHTWVVSDTHFGHNNIVDFCHRPEDHDQLMIAEWRAHVPPEDTVLHLGDLCYRGNAYFKNIVAPELTGARKLLIKGNHDKSSFKFYKDCGFKLARPFGLKLGIENGRFTVADPDTAGTYTVSFSHYPWGPPEDEGRISPFHVRIHGHIHNTGYRRFDYVPFLMNHINVSIEQTKYRPVNLRLLLEGAILGTLPGTTAEEEALVKAASDRSRERRGL